MKKVLLSSFFLLMLPLVANADEAVEIDGIYYNLIAKGKVAEITKNPNGYNFTGSLVIPSTVTYNGEEYTVTKILDATEDGYWNGVFANCSGVTSVSLPNSLTRIGRFAFGGCSGLTNLVIPNGVKEIGDGAFYSCGLTTVSIPSSMEAIESEAFRGCSRLKSVHITDLEAWCKISFGKNGRSPFGDILATGYDTYHLYLNGEEIKDLVIPSSITTIGANTFYGCDGLISVTIPEGVTSIGNNAFYGCNELTSIAIPKTVLSIGGEAFRFCSKLTSVYITDLEAWCQITFGGRVTEQWVIANPLSYAHHLFLNGEEIKNLKIPNSITKIKSLAFYGCSGFTSITIPSSVTDIESGAFYGCSSLTSLNIPNSVKTIGERAFYECSSLSSLTIGNSVSRIASKAFSECKELSEVYCYAETVPNNGDEYPNFYSNVTDFFDNSYIEYCTLNIPLNSVNAYKTTKPWSSFGTIKAIEGGTEPETQKCATPSISYADKKLTYTCTTEGVEFVSEIKDADITKYYDSEVSLSATYEISVYATKSGYENSDVATATLVWTNAVFTETTPETPTSAKVIAETIPMLISANEGKITVNSEAEGQTVNVYTMDGKALGSGVIRNGKATIQTNQPSGESFIVKAGTRSVKMLMK